MFKEIMENVQKNTPLVHCITNYVTVNDCANAILAAGASPIMADDSDEVEDITTICSALIINIGTLNSRTIKSMHKAGKKANRINHPVVLDPVGAGASTLRNETTRSLLDDVVFTVIRGNISEIKFIAGGSTTTKGVDASAADVVTEDNIDQVVTFAKALSLETDSVVAITGAIDIVANSERAYIIRNGHSMMSKITGTGCMLSAVIGGYLGANPTQALEATAAAVAGYGLCGEIAMSKLGDGGTSTYRALLIDAISKLNYQTLEEGMKIETR